MRHGMTGTFWMLALCVAGCLGLSRTASAEQRTHALLVGVSGYTNLEDNMQLAGPRNDVALFRDLLLERRVRPQDMTVLADGLAGAGNPTKREIMRGLDGIAQRAQRGDLVFLMFAGHGSQAPSKDEPRNEPDGLDEIFMPGDIGRWDGELGLVTNSITDNELGSKIAAIRAKGAFVWAVFDSCHSGTITRGNSGGRPTERSRQVEPTALGIPPEALRSASARAARSPDAPRSRGFGDAQREMTLDRGGSAGGGQGGFVAFYAAQSNETTPEDLYPLYAADAVQHGLFTFSLYSAISAHPDATYRQIIESVLQSYQGGGRPSPTPTYEGTGLDAQIFGSAAGRRVTQWRLDNDGKKLALRAGLIQQVTKGSILAVVPTPTADDGDTLGYVQVDSATSAAAQVVPVAYRGKPALAIGSLAGATYARPVDLKVDFTLRVSAPVAGGECLASDSRTTAAVTALQGMPELTRRIRWVGATEPADVRMCRTREGIRFLDGSGTLAADPRMRGPALVLPATQGAAAGDARILGEWLQKISSVTNLSRLAAGMGTATRAKVELYLERRCDADDRSCDPAPQAILPTSRPSVRDGDTIKVVVTNPTIQPIDVTILYVDSTYGITALFPDPQAGDTSPRLEPIGTATANGGRIEFPITVNADTTGFERLMVIGVPAPPQSPVTSLVGLAQQGVRGEGVSRGHGSGGGGLADLLQDAAFGSDNTGSTRGPPSRGQATSADFSTFGWTVVPTAK